MTAAPVTAHSPFLAEDRPALARWVALPVFLGCVTLLAVSYGLTPSDAGMGTHTQLGITPCGFLAQTGLPCAACGMTTSFAHATDGRLLRAFITQPAGATLALLTAMLALLSGWSLVSGMSLLPLARALWRPRVIVLAIGLVLGSWAYTAGWAALHG